VSVGCNFSGDATHGAVSRTAGATLQPGPLSLIRVDPDQATIDGGTSVQFAALPYDVFSNLITSPVGTPTWSSSNTSAVTIDAAGKATAANVLSDVTVTITATIGSESDQATLTVNAVPFGPTAVDDAATGALNNGTITISGNLLSNDVGNPAPFVTSFGGGSFSGTFVPGSGVQTGANGATLSLQANGTLAFTATVAATYTFSYTIANGLGSTSTATVTLTVNAQGSGGSTGGNGGGTNCSNPGSTRVAEDGVIAKKPAAPRGAGILDGPRSGGMGRPTFTVNGILQCT
jgi:hypothetical protein